MARFRVSKWNRERRSGRHHHAKPAFFLTTNVHGDRLSPRLHPVGCIRQGRRGQMPQRRMETYRTRKSSLSVWLNCYSFFDCSTFDLFPFDSSDERSKQLSDPLTSIYNFLCKAYRAPFELRGNLNRFKIG